MKIALYGRHLKEDSVDFIKGLAVFFADNNITACIHENIRADFLNRTKEFDLEIEKFISRRTNA